MPGKTRRTILFATGMAVILALPLLLGLDRSESRKGEAPMASASPAAPALAAAKESMGNASPLSTLVTKNAVAGLFPPLEVGKEKTDRGFRLSFKREVYPRITNIANATDVSVHRVERSQEREGGRAWSRNDALVVDPSAMEARVYPLYEMEALQPTDGGLFEMIDDTRLLFVRPRLSGDEAGFDLATMNIRDGTISVVSPGFWTTKIGEYGQFEDHLLSSRYAKGKHGGAGRVMLTSFKGRMWIIDVATGEVRTSGEEAYPAYGDLGSKPLRELVYPSPDLTRFVSQKEAFANRFELIDPDAEKKIADFAFGDDVVLTDPGIVWSPDGQYFFLEYGNKKDERAIYTDNGRLLFAQGIRFYDRDGRIVRDLKLPRNADADARMSVFGWAGEGQAWIETFGTEKREEGDPVKGEPSYRLYDIAKGSYTDYETVGDENDLRDAEIHLRHEGYSFRSRAYLLADSRSRRLWHPTENARVIRNGDRIYSAVQSEEEGSSVQRWDSSGHAWKPADRRSNAESAGIRISPTIEALSSGWLVYRRQTDPTLEYVKAE